jgi:hypothetical protein
MAHLKRSCHQLEFFNRIAEYLEGASCLNVSAGVLGQLFGG